MRRGLAVSKTNLPGKCHTDPIQALHCFRNIHDDGR